MSSHNFLIHGLNRRIAQSLPYRGRVVDLGCGTATYKEIILNLAEEYIGVDWPDSLHSSTNVDVFSNLNLELPFKDNFADTVTAFQVMEHLSEPSLFLAECHRILRPEGQLFITVPFMWHVHEAPYDYFRYTRFGLEYLLTKVGFVSIDIRENTGFWQMWFLKFNYHTTRFARGPLKYLWFLVWWLNQTAAPILDKYDPHFQETASYTVLAAKA
ncbi:MAG: class I SAM-dependent methyltransferase [Anaerolineae bacterium]|nr:class I SAM-dependent methyltransferase [Anaerolineae bacterium]MCB0210508.1 class I SAM-dependent methyltransferase [Anaerolineae bacterium]